MDVTGGGVAVCADGGGSTRGAIRWRRPRPAAGGHHAPPREVPIALDELAAQTEHLLAPEVGRLSALRCETTVRLVGVREVAARVVDQPKKRARGGVGSIALEGAHPEDDSLSRLSLPKRSEPFLARTAVCSSMSGLVSVIIPTFDRRQALREAVDSVLSQSHPEVEVIVVDDGSTDGTGEFMASAFDDPRVRYRYQANAGVSAARNAGLDLATGAYIAFLDSDDTWEPWHLSLLVAGLDRHPEVGLIWTETKFVDPLGVVTASPALAQLLSAYGRFSREELFASSSPLTDLGVDLPTSDRDQRLYVGDIFSPMIMGNFVLTSSAVIRRDRVDEVGRFDEHLRVGEDYDFFLRACRAGPVAFADVVDTRYRIGTADKLGGPRTSLAMARGYLHVLEHDPRSRHGPDHAVAGDDRGGSSPRTPLGRRAGAAVRFASSRARAPGARPSARPASTDDHRVDPPHVPAASGPHEPGRIAPARPVTAR